jgi:hypothetical protein
VNAKTPVTLICKVHGSWEASPDNHISKKRGCPTCGGSKKKSTEEFISEALKKHGDKYDYSSAIYKNAHAEIKIICKVHGELSQSPSSHLSGSGCPKCAIQNRVSSERKSSIEMIKDYLLKNGGHVKIVEDSFQNMQAEACFMCDKHGVYKRLASAVLYGKHPCPECFHSSSQTNLLSQEQAETKVQSLLSGGTQCNDFHFTGSKTTSLTLTCPKHGEWTIRWNGFIRSLGRCPRCAYDLATPKRVQGLVSANKRGKDNRWNIYLSGFLKMHGNRFDYSKVVYITLWKLQKIHHNLLMRYFH